jgi:hypothetical protein
MHSHSRPVYIEKLFSLGSRDSEIIDIMLKPEVNSIEMPLAAKLFNNPHILRLHAKDERNVGRKIGGEIHCHVLSSLTAQ